MSVPHEHIQHLVERHLQGRVSESDFSKAMMYAKSRAARLNNQALQMVEVHARAECNRVRRLYPLVGRRTCFVWRAPSLEGVVPHAMHMRLPKELTRGVAPGQAGHVERPDFPTTDDAAGKAALLYRFRAADAGLIGAVSLANLFRQKGHEFPAWDDVWFFVLVGKEPLLMAFSTFYKARRVAVEVAHLLDEIAIGPGERMVEDFEDKFGLVKLSEAGLRKLADSEGWDRTLWRGRHPDAHEVMVELSAGSASGNRRRSLDSAVQDLECPSCGHCYQQDHLERQSRQPVHHLGVLFPYHHPADGFVEYADLEVHPSGHTLHFSSRYTVSMPAMVAFAQRLMLAFDHRPGQT